LRKIAQTRAHLLRPRIYRTIHTQTAAVRDALLPFSLNTL
jgi:hypothetical protein